MLCVWFVFFLVEWIVVIPSVARGFFTVAERSSFLGYNTQEWINYRSISQIQKLVSSDPSTGFLTEIEVSRCTGIVIVSYNSP